MSEADTCRTSVVPRLQSAGWEHDLHQIREQVAFTDGRIFISGGTARRAMQRGFDYLLRYTPDIALAVVEANAALQVPGRPCRR